MYLPADAQLTGQQIWAHNNEVPVELKARRWRLAIVRAEQMQEFAWPGRTAETELALDLEKAALRREFEQRLRECGTLSFQADDSDGAPDPSARIR